MHLQEIGHFFVALPALHRAMRELSQLSGYWNYAHRERDAVFGLASTLFGVMIVDVETLQRAISTFIDQWAEWTNSPSRHHDLSDSVEWFSGSIGIRDPWIQSIGDRVRHFGGANSLLNLVNAGGMEMRSYEYFDIVRSYFSGLVMRYRMPAGTLYSPRDLIVFSTTNYDWKTELTTKDKITSPIFIPTDNAVYIAIGFGTNDATSTIAIGGLLKHARVVNATLDLVGIVDDVAVKTPIIKSNSSTSGNNVHVRFGDTQCNVGTGVRYSFKIGDSATLVFGTTVKPGKDSTVVIRISGKFQLSPVGVETMMTFTNYTTANHLGGWTASLGQMMATYSGNCSTDIVASLDTAIYTSMKRAFTRVYGEDLALTFPTHFYQLNTFTAVVMKLNKPTSLTDTSKAMILLCYVRLAMFFMTPFMLSPLRI